MTSSRSASNGSERPAAGSGPAVRPLLRAIVRERAIHARWLNTLSLLEQVGAQKIAKSQRTPFLSSMVVRHLAEESRHAQYFKRLSDRIAPGACPTYESRYLLAGRAARRYFERLDAHVTGSLGGEAGAREEHPGAAYLYVTLAVERRAERVYPLYQEVLDETPVPVSLKGVIAEETHHLAEMERALAARDPGWRARADEFQAAEEALFGEWMSALARAVAERPGR